MRMQVDSGVLGLQLLMTILLIVKTAETRKGRLSGSGTAVVAAGDDTIAATEPTELRGRASRETAKPGRYRVKPARRPGDTPAEHGLRQTAQSVYEPTAYRHDSSHCNNGGTGFLQTFCFCHADFTGRYCEHPVNSSCGAVEHGVWVYRNCSYCVCADGQLLCRRHELEGCTYQELIDTSEHQSTQDAQMTPVVQPLNSCSIPKGSVLVMCLLLAFHRMLDNFPVR